MKRQNLRLLPAALLLGGIPGASASSPSLYTDHEEAVRRGGVGNYIMRTDSPQQAQEKVAEAPKPETPVVTEKRAALDSSLTDEPVLFDVGSAELTGAAEERLARLGEELAGNPDQKIRVEGHTDSLGPSEQNEQLSVERATAVGRVLVGAGAGMDQVAVRGHGERDPIAANDSADGRSQNRRVELHVERSG